MKSLLRILLILLLPHLVQAAQELHLKQSTVRQVRIYSSGAQVDRTVEFNAEKGYTTVYIEGLSAAIDVNSILVSGTGNANVMSYSFRLDYLTGERKPAEVMILEDSLKKVSEEMEKAKGMEEVYLEEVSFLGANKSVNGANVGVDIDNLKEVAEYFRTRMIQLKSDLIDIHDQQKKLKETQDRLSRQLAEMNAKYNRPQGTVVVDLQAREDTRVRLNLQYYTSGATWSPTYDLRAASIGSPIQFVYQANVSQSCNEDWKNVRLVLSTGNPSIGGTKPELSPWYLDFYAPVVLYNKSMQQGMREMAMPAMVQGVSDEALTSTASLVTLQDGGLTTDFEISVPYTISGDGRSVTVDIRDQELPAVYQYRACPKLDKDAFLMAKVSGWQDLNLLPGPAKVYFEGNYVGSTSINPGVTTDTLSLSLGRDKRIVVTRELKKEFSQSRTVGGNIIKESVYQLTVKNTLKTPIDFVLEDQLPISKNSEIKVNVGELSGGVVEEGTGKVTWTMRLDPMASETHSIGFSVKSPKGKPMPAY